MLQFVHYRVEDAGYRTIQCIGYYVVVIYVIDDVLARAVWQTSHVYIRKVTFSYRYTSAQRNSSLGVVQVYKKKVSSIKI